MKCNVPIDQETKMPLVGDALSSALKDPTSPRCGQELAADDVFCPACGARVDDSYLDDYWKCISLTQHHIKGRASRRELWKVWLKATLVYVVVCLFVIVSRFMIG